MRRWTRWAATAAGAAGAGAGLAVARHRSRAASRPPDIAPFSTPTAPLAADPPPGAPEDPADDPAAALDAARQRLRDRADALRRDIESSGGRPESA